MRGGEGVETRPAESHANALSYKSVPGAHRAQSCRKVHLHGTGFSPPVSPLSMKPTLGRLCARGKCFV